VLECCRHIDAVAIEPESLLAAASVATIDCIVFYLTRLPVAAPAKHRHSLMPSCCMLQPLLQYSDKSCWNAAEMP